MKDYNRFICTDPDTLQFREVIGTEDKKEYKFIEFDRHNYPEEYEVLAGKSASWICEDEFSGPLGEGWLTGIVVLSEYSLKKLSEVATTYNNGLDEVVEIYGDDADAILAEMVWEVEESGLY
jgi:hypothetical protein